jgi:hypothetical protein
VDSLSRSGSAAEPAKRLWLADQTLSTLRWAAAAGWTLVILLLCWLPHTVVREVEDNSSWFEIPYLDKIVHGGIFVVFAVLWLRAPRAPGQLGYGWVALGGLILAVVSEVGQNMAWVGRDASVADTLTDWAGLAVGLLLAPLLEPGLRALEFKLFRVRSKPASSIPSTAVASEEQSQSTR